VGIFVGTTFDFRFSEIPLEMRLGIHGFVDGICGLVLGHTHKDKNSNLMLSLWRGF
jgi:hypothetical protein